MKRRELLKLVAAGALWPARAAAEEGVPVAIVGGELRRSGEAPLKDAVVTIAGETIGSISQGHAGGEVIDARGKIVTAGFCDLLTRIGVVEIELEPTSHDDRLADERPVRAAFAAADGYDPASSAVAVTRREGLTSVGVTPAAGLVMGQSAWVDLAGETPAEAVATASLALHVLIDDAFLGSGAGNRATALLTLRELFDDARLYAKNRAQFERRQLRDLGATRLDLEVVVRALEGALPVVFHVDRASDIQRVVKLVKEHSLRGVLASAAEAWKVRDELADANVPCIVYPLDEGPRSFMARGAREENAALLHQAGVTVALSTGEIHDARKLRQGAGNAVRAGLPHAAALDAITDAPARIFGLGDRYGSPKPGRLANLAIWSGDPFEPSTKLEALFIRGRQVDLRSRQTALFERYKSLR